MLPPLNPNSLPHDDKKRTRLHSGEAIQRLITDTCIALPPKRWDEKLERRRKNFVRKKRNLRKREKTRIALTHTKGMIRFTFTKDWEHRDLFCIMEVIRNQVVTAQYAEIQEMRALFLYHGSSMRSNRNGVRLCRLSTYQLA